MQFSYLIGLESRHYGRPSFRAAISGLKCLMWN